MENKDFCPNGHCLDTARAAAPHACPCAAGRDDGPASCNHPVDQGGSFTTRVTVEATSLPSERSQESSTHPCVLPTRSGDAKLGYGRVKQTPEVVCEKLR